MAAQAQLAAMATPHDASTAGGCGRSVYCEQTVDLQSKVSKPWRAVQMAASQKPTVA